MKIIIILSSFFAVSCAVAKPIELPSGRGHIDASLFPDGTRPTAKDLQGPKTIIVDGIKRRERKFLPLNK